MGVYVSMTVEVGFVVDKDVMDAYMSENDPNEAGEEEVLEELLEDESLLDYGFAGSYYDNKYNPVWISVSRLSTGGSGRGLDGGVYGVARPVVTMAEREALQRVAYKLGQPFSDAYQFVSVLWS